MYLKSVKMSPPQLLILTFIISIAVGTVILKLPFSTTGGISWVDAFFTSTSAMTVTGLAVIDTGKSFTLFGEVAIMILIQLGGLGIMSFAVLIYIMLGRKIGFKGRMILQQALNQTSIGGVIRLVKTLLFYSIIIEFIAFLMLCLRWIPEFGWKTGSYYSLFHSISAFNNAGFALWPDGLSRYVGDPVVNLVITLLFIIGGLGFTVLTDLWYKKEFRQLTLHSKMMIVGTLIINVVAMLTIFGLEFNNPNTLGSLTANEQFWASYFQAVTTRTAGFNTVDIGGLENSTVLFMVFLMFIGAGSASTGGGIKLTTFMIIFLAVFSFIKGKKDIVIFKKSLASFFILKALAIFMISVLFVFLALFIINITEELPFLELLFEVVSAFGTVGLSMGITADLSAVGKIVIIFIMFLGKLGPLTLAFSLAKPEKTNVKYPSEDVLTG
ncbi:TrkH family potassium uptake protein [Mesobacillus harenae]|uniref:TrkH family potassium uptake protein n=1 Tax=Mesobacillus harenae TaxID=2213203 RepID=UPI00158125D4|nr:TrkH family potassium uptake protein [Mesobacillus harenae]